MKEVFDEFTKKMLDQQELILEEISKKYEIQEIRQAPAIDGSFTTDNGKTILSKTIYKYIIVEVKNKQCLLQTGDREMSELIEINEDNCVLSENEMGAIDLALNVACRSNPGLESTFLKKIYTKIFLKINKLNDMAKEKER